MSDETVMTRDEFKRELSVMEGHASEWGRILDHDAALRTKLAETEKQLAEERVHADRLAAALECATECQFDDADAWFVDGEAYRHWFYGYQRDPDDVSRGRALLDHAARRAGGDQKARGGVR